MTILKLLVILIENLPAIVRLLNAMAEEAEKEQVRKKVQNDLKTIEEAFRNKDSESLDKLFRS